METLKKLGDFLGATVDYLLTGKDLEYDRQMELRKQRMKQFAEVHNERFRATKLNTEFKKLNQDGQEKLIEHAQLLTKIPEYRADQQPDTPDHLAVYAAHERTDVEVTDDMRTHDYAVMNDDSMWE